MDLERQERVGLFREAFDREYESIWRFAFGLVKNEDDADNIVKKAFVKLWEKGESLADKVDVRKKLYVMARGFAFDHLRHEKVIRKGRKGWQVIQDFSTEDPASNALTTAETLRLVRDKMDLLPPVGREMLNDFYLNGKSAEEIARKREINRNSVYDTINNTLDRLRELLGIRSLRKKKSK